MGAFAAPISNLLVPLQPNPSTNPNSSPQKLTQRSPLIFKATSAVQTRRLLLLSLPVSFSIQFSSWCSALASLAESDAISEVSQRVAEATRLLERGRELQAQGNFNQALDYFTRVVKNYKEFAFSDYARVGRALALYEVGDREEAISEMEDVSVSLKGYPEVHAALAAALYVDKHAPLLAENQFAIATVLDPRYTDLSYVRETKHWPPSLVSSLEHFITLS